MIGVSNFTKGDRVRVIGGDECPECAEQLEAARWLVKHNHHDNAEPFIGTIEEVIKRPRTHRRSDHKFLVRLDDLGVWSFHPYELILAREYGDGPCRS